MYVVHGTTAGVSQVSELRPGIWFSWQGLAVFLIGLASQYEMQPHSHPDAPSSHSMAQLSSRRSSFMAALIVWVRAVLALTLFATDLAYLILHAVKCFSLDCTVDHAAQCCAEGTLYGIALVGVLLQVFLAAIMLYILGRLPWIPRYYIRDPIDIAAVSMQPSPLVSTVPVASSVTTLHELFGPPAKALSGYDEKST